jgi:hypothetical protein
MHFDFTQILTLILIGLLFGKDTILPWVMQKFGFKTDNTFANVSADNRNALQPLYLKMDELTQYANHETTEHTEILREIRDNLRDNTGFLRDNFALIHSKHSEWDRRGIPTEACNKK